MQVYDDVWPGTPTLDSATYSSCFAARLSGEVFVRNNTNIQFFSQDTAATYYTKFRYVAPGVGGRAQQVLGCWYGYTSIFV